MNDPAPSRRGPGVVYGISLAYQHALALRHFLRIAPFDTSSEQGRSHERYRRIILTIATSGLNRALVFFTTLVTVPITLGYLGLERYGLWMMISSTLGLLTLADLGLGSGIVNAILHAGEPEQRESLRVSVASTFYLLAGISALIMACVMATGHVVSWPAMFNVHSGTAVKESFPTVAVVVFCTVAAIPLALAQRVQTAYQEGFISNLSQCIGSIFALGCVIAAANLRAGLPVLAAALMGPPLVTSAVNHFLYFHFSRPWLAPRLSAFDWMAARNIGFSGAAFLVVQLSAILGAPLDNLVISHVLGPASVALYAVPSRLFAVVPILMTILITPFWSPYGEAWKRDDVAWIKRAFRRTFSLSLLVNISVCALVVAFGGSLIRAWVGADVVPNPGFLIALAVWTMVVNLTYPCYMLLFGIGALRYLVSAILIVTPISTVLKIVSTQAFGLNGICWGGATAQLFFFTIPMLVYIRSRIERRERAETHKATPV